MFKVILHRKVRSEIGSLPDRDRKRVLDAIRSMELDPFSGDVKPVKAIRGVFRKSRRYRVAFTVNFEIGEVVVLKVGKRERCCEEL